MKTLVLGATGFIGGHIALSALGARWSVRGLRRNSKSTGHLGDAPLEWVNGNLGDPVSLRDAMQDIDIVFHAAAYYPQDGNPRKVPQQVAYAKGEIQQVLDAAKEAGIRRFVFTSTLSTIGHPAPEENRLADERDIYRPGTLPESGYYEAKIAMENAVLEAAAEGLDAVVLNPTAVFGPGDVHLTMGQLLIMVARCQAVAWLPGDINVVDVRDVAQAHIAAVQKGRSGERYIIGGHNYSVKDALTAVAQNVGVKPPRFEVPMRVLKALVFLSDIIPALPLPSNHLRALPLWQGYNIEKAKQELGLSPRPFYETVQDALNWFGEEGYL
ncbi:MAG: NAD-dependent epimerase/dehydratase family protein [Anaerolineales bacterium]|nr:NAD-dependent epimerase/dehydratase family protein [Chloroflexota bacterium]MBL6979773.1 NAD-dependent epimerase/dehydratase family protein [Anaerolineales bacterium]